MAESLENTTFGSTLRALDNLQDSNLQHSMLQDGATLHPQRQLEDPAIRGDSPVAVIMDGVLSPTGVPSATGKT